MSSCITRPARRMRNRKDEEEEQEEQEGEEWKEEDGGGAGTGEKARMLGQPDAKSILNKKAGTKKKRVIFFSFPSSRKALLLEKL